MAAAPDLEVENGRLSVALKRIWNLLEEEKQTSNQLRLEVDKLRKESALLKVNVPVGAKTCCQIAAMMNEKEENIVLLQREIDGLRKAMASLNVPAAALNFEEVRPACDKCGKIHPANSKWCSLVESVRERDLPSVRAYLSAMAMPRSFQGSKHLDMELRIAVMKGFDNIVPVLLRAGAFTGRRVVGGDSVIHLASKEYNVVIVRALLDHGIDVNMRGENGWTPLHWAAYDGSPEIIRLLLDRGADASITDNAGNTALSHAYSRKKRESTRILEEHRRAGLG